jgi:bifunctional DNA-binding transcriptional regulator/antitoxin component of YhaV-PrlF toxin-antitoxin module
MTTAIKTATSRGQVTLPVEWCKQFNTNDYLFKWEDRTLIINPIDVAALVDDNEKEKIIFDADRDNNGKPLSGNELRNILSKIDG